MQHDVRNFEDTLPDDCIVTLHKLCQHCHQLATSSKILREVPAKHYQRQHKGSDGDDNDNNNESDETESREAYLHATYTELRSSYLDGCHLCSQIYHRLTSSDLQLLQSLSERPEEEARLGLTIYARESAQVCSINIQSSIDPQSSVRIFPNLPIFAVNGNSSVAGEAQATDESHADHPSHPPVQTPFAAQSAVSTSSPASLELASYWLNRCLSTHSTCTRQQQSSKTHPRRLVDLGTCRDPSVIRLYDLMDEEQIENTFEPKRYLTLSHCWGAGQTSILTKGNLEDWKCRIPLEKLPQTFRDAITTAQKLGYQYLWIDSLCIIQDSAEDWSEQAGQMATIYGHSDCTLAALGPDSRTGFFARRNPLLRRPCRLLEGEAFSVYAYGHDASPPGWNRRGLDDDRPDFFLNQAPLLGRAWVLQERLISPRVLYFGGKGLFWECCEDKASEFWPSGSPKFNHWQANPAFKTIFSSILNSDLLSKEDGRDKLAETWNSIVEAYTASSLSFPSDRAVALSGVAALIQERTGAKYVAGLWVELLPKALLWTRSTSKKDSSSKFTPVSPSWAWLPVQSEIISRSTRAGMNVFNVQTIRSAHLVDHNVTLSPLPCRVLGDVVSGWVIIRGLFKQMTGPVKTTTEPFEPLPMARDPRREHNFAFTSDVDLYEDMDLHFLLIDSTEYQIEHHPRLPWTSAYQSEIQEQGLVLQPRRSSGADGYVRVGYFSNIYQHDWPDQTPLVFANDEIEQDICIH